MLERTPEIEPEPIAKPKVKTAPPGDRWAKPMLSHFPKRATALEHLSDEAASICPQAFRRHRQGFMRPRRAPQDLRRLTWHNPRILDAAHERMGLFRIGVQSKIMAAVLSRSAKRRRWGFDAMFDSYEFRDHPLASARWSAPVRREQAARVVDARVVLERQAMAELAREQEREREMEREREIEDDRRRERERIEVMIQRRPSAPSPRRFELVAARRSSSVSRAPPVARDHPLTRRGVSASVGESRAIRFHWAEGYCSATLTNADRPLHSSAASMSALTDVQIAGKPRRLAMKVRVASAVALAALIVGLGAARADDNLQTLEGFRYDGADRLADRPAGWDRRRTPSDRS